jgi:hypothetical protein
VSGVSSLSDFCVVGVGVMGAEGDLNVIMLAGVIGAS